MNDFAKRWVEALRSGEYRQGYIYLNQNNKFCALGVACDLMRDKLHIINYGCGITQYDGHKTVTPVKVRQALGLITDLGYLNGNKDTISNKSDSGVPFTEIADLIEQHQGELFHE